MAADITPTAYFMIGAPGEGKSTYVKTELLPELNMLGRNIAHISADAIRRELMDKTGAEFQDTLNDQRLNNLVEDSVAIQIKKEVAENKDLIIDRTNTSKRFRHQAMRHIPKHYRKVAIVVGENDAHRCAVNMLSRDVDLVQSGQPPRLTPFRTIKAKIDEFEFPSTKEGFDQILQVTYGKVTDMIEEPSRIR